MDNSESISIVLPVFNEASNLRPLHEALMRQLEEVGVPYEMIFVDDGSHDGSLEVLRELSRKDPHLRAVSLSRNFGHQYAITAGMEYARGEAVVVMDADLQHPPELIPKMVDVWRSGVQVVYTVREDDEKASWFKRWTSSAFYKLMNCMSDTPIVPGAADFRLMDRTVVDALVAMPERSRFLRGMVSWLGFRQQSLTYRANPRFSGKSKYSLGRMLTLALQGITSFSSVPLRVSAYVGLFAAVVGLPYAIWAIYAKCFTDITVPGWTSLLIAVLFLGGVQLMSIGVIGEYVGRIYTEVKRRPLYLTKELIGFEQAGTLAEPQSSAIFRFHSPHSEPGTRRGANAHR
ncbi:MAG: glycosyltransferase family 2 protein [Thermoguttaceae bacterium]